MYFIGNITREVFRSKDSDYAVVVFQTSEDGPDPGAQKVIFGAILKEFTKQDRLRVYGSPKVSEKYGPQFHVESMMRELKSPEQYRSFMINEVAGIGPRRPRLLIARFCNEGELAHVMEQQPERLLEIKGVSENLALRMSESWIENAPKMALANLLDEIGVGTGRVPQIHRALGDNAEQIIRENPYRLIDVHGIAFKTADAAANLLHRYVPEYHSSFIDLGDGQRAQYFLEAYHMCQFGMRSVGRCRYVRGVDCFSRTDAQQAFRLMGILKLFFGAERPQWEQFQQRLDTNPKVADVVLGKVMANCGLAADAAGKTPPVVLVSKQDWSQIEFNSVVQAAIELPAEGTVNVEV
jgi:hypothetical protein